MSSDMMWSVGVISIVSIVLLIAWGFWCRDQIEGDVPSTSYERPKTNLNPPIADTGSVWDEIFEMKRSYYEKRRQERSEYLLKLEDSLKIVDISLAEAERDGNPEVVVRFIQEQVRLIKIITELKGLR